VSLEPGASIGRYRVEAMIGRGGMGSVYRAFDLTLRRPVALKVLHDAMTRLVREARLAASLSHPNIVSVLDVGEHERIAYMAMELLDGRPLRFLLRTPLSVEEKLRWIADVARALAAAHASGLIHRDVKPQNVMVTSAGAKLLDFGLAKELDAAAAKKWTALLPSLRTQPGYSMGTPQYMAPEVLRGELPSDALTDQFAWGLLAYETLVGNSPRGDDLASLGIGKAWTPPPVPDVSPRLSTIVVRALDDDREARFGSMSDVVLALETCLAPIPRTVEQTAAQAAKTLADAADDDDPLPAERRVAPTRLFAVRAPSPEMMGGKSADPSPAPAPQAPVRAPKHELLGTFADAARKDLREVPGGFEQAVAIITLDVEKGKARFFVQLVATNPLGDLFTPAASMDLVRAAGAAIADDAKDGNGRWLRLVIRLKRGEARASVLEIG
jgi:serine/threonine-protein kinase